MSTFAIQVILCLKVRVDISLPCLVHTAVPLSGKLEMVLLMLLVFVLCIFLYFGGKIAVYLKLKIVSHIPGSNMESILYPWK